METWIWILYFAIFTMSVVLHEVAHGVAAFRLGDPTAYLQKRLTLNPLRHIDPVWTIVMPIVMIQTLGVAFGGAKPVPVNPLRFHNPRKGMMWVALAGPLTNIAIALFLAALLSFERLIATGGAVTMVTETVLSLSILMNLYLAAFNMLPIPPLDGSRVLAGLADRQTAHFIYGLERYGLLILIGLMMMPRMGLPDVFGAIYTLAETAAALLGVTFA